MSKLGKRKEKTFQTEIKWSVDNYNRANSTEFEYFKFADMTYTTRGYDMEIIGYKRLICIELKIAKTVNTINFRTLFRDREHEIKKLLQREEQGFESLVLVNHYNKEKRINDVYVFDTCKVKECYEKDSVIKVNLSQGLFKLPRIKDEKMNRYVWDLSEII